MMKILAIAGSLRKDSFNRQLALSAQTLLKGTAELELLDYSSVPPLNEDIEFPAPEGVAQARQKVEEADGIWFFTPEYNHAVPGVLKNLIDWLSRPVSQEKGQVLNGKPTAISGITPGMSGTAIAQDQLIPLLSFLNMKIMNVPRLTIPHANSQAEGNKLVLKDSLRYLDKQAKAFVSFIETAE